MHSDQLDSVLTRKETAKILGVTPSTLDRMRKDGGFPHPIKLSPQRIGWRQSDLSHWIATRPAMDRP